MPSPLDTTTTDYLRLQTQEIQQQSLQLRLYIEHVRCETLRTRIESLEVRQRSSAQCLQSRQLREAVIHQRRFAALMDHGLLYVPRRPVSSLRRPAPEKLDSLALIECCKAGEPRAWNELVRRYESLIFSFARSLCGNTADAADITAEVFVRLFNSLHTFRRGATSFRSWLFRIIHNTYVDVCIRDNNHGHLSLDAPLSAEEPGDGHEVVDDAPSPEMLLLSRDQLQRLAEGIQNLPAYQRQVLALYVKGRSYEQIAAETGLSMGTVKSRLNRARKTLQERLEADERLPDRQLRLHRPRRCLA